MGRNTHLLREIIEVLADQVFNKDTALRDLERRFNTRLIIDAGNVDTIQKHAKKLRLRVEREELPLVCEVYWRHEDQVKAGASEFIAVKA